VNGFTDHLYTRLVSTSNYSATANLHNSQIITAPAKPFPACCVFTSLSLATASNSGDSSASRAHAIPYCPPSHNWLRPLLITSQHRPCRNTPFHVKQVVQESYDRSSEGYWVHLVLRPTQPQMIDKGDCGATGGTKIGKGNRSTRRKRAPAPFCPLQIPLARPGLEPGPPRWEASD
jgi:hypothetical protein